MRHRLIILAATCVLSILCGCIAGSNIDLRNAQGSGVEVLEDFDEDADRHGVMAMLTLALPEFDKAVYYSGGWWPAGGNRVYPTVCRDFSEVPEGGVFSLIKLRDGDYLAILPLAGKQAYAWFQGGDRGSSLERTARMRSRATFRCSPGPGPPVPTRPATPRGKPRSSMRLSEAPR